MVHSKRHYMITIGTAEISTWQTSDRRAVKLARRWVRRFWSRYVARIDAGPFGKASLASQVCNDPEILCYVHRTAYHPVRGMIDFTKRPAKITQFGPEAA